MKLHDRSIWDQKTMWKESIWTDECPFCKEEESTTVWKWKYWKIVYNKYPYNWLKNNLLLVPYRHCEHTMELNNDELIELKDADKFFNEYYKGENYFSFIRQTNGGKSIKHLHYHYLPWILYSDKLENIMKNQHIKNN